VDREHRRELQVETHVLVESMADGARQSPPHAATAQGSTPVPQEPASPPAPSPPHLSVEAGPLAGPVPLPRPDPPAAFSSIARDRRPRAEPAPALPVQVRIDRLEVRISPPKPAAPRSVPAAPRQPDLERFLADLEGRS
jgi:hypothetical protein